MASPEITPAPNSFTVVTWNILLDKTRTARGLIEPQSERLSSQAATLRDLNVPLDVVAIQEAHVTDQQHNGQELARLLGMQAGFWYEHNTSKRTGEYIGMFGELVENAEVVELPYDKKLVITKIGDKAIGNLHLRREDKFIGPKRAEQMRAVMEALAPYEKAVVVGDDNSLFFQESRRILRDYEFTSAFSSLMPTFPTPRYRDIFLRPNHTISNAWVNCLWNAGVRLDIISARNLRFGERSRFLGDSDHYGLYAELVDDAA
mgnify:FL=1